jgi:hypothetical protein
MKWTQKQAIALCVLIESICPNYACHVALTGGMLYKHGERKDCDLLFYRIRQAAKIDMEGLFDALSEIGFENIRGLGWCYKAEFEGRKLDLFFPEQPSGEYNQDELVEREQARDEKVVFDDIAF